MAVAEDVTELRVLADCAALPGTDSDIKMDLLVFLLNGQMYSFWDQAGAR